MVFGGTVYIITNFNNTTLYTGVTSDLQVRMYEHINHKYLTSFSKRYKLYKLVYYKSFSSIEEAIHEEKRIKAGSRAKKEALINKLNPLWDDLYQREVKDW